MQHRHTFGVLTLVAVALVGSGCGADDPSSSADCTSQIRLDGQVYSAHSYSARPGTKAGAAEVARCEDNGPDAAGSVFGNDPDHATVWSFQGYPTTKVLGVRFQDDSFEVFVADSVPGPEAERIRSALSR